MASSSDEADEIFVFLGTPVPELLEDQPGKKPTQLENLTARDKQGRRRFHGAFTGGFSAGYFNTVATKEGFTPSTFVSSRHQRFGKCDSKPEDYMDEEDVEEHGIAPRKFATTGCYTSEERTRKRQENSHQLAASLTELILPEQTSIGIKLLCKMGWREGQGLGPRIKRTRKRLKNSVPKQEKCHPMGKDPGVKLYGCATLPSDGEESEDSDDFVPEDMSTITFAPKDVTPVSLEAKDNVHGLGYHGLNPYLALPGLYTTSLFDDTPIKSGTSRKGIRGQAFGVGAFEEEDEDIYTVDTMANYNITMQPDDDEDNKFGWTAPRDHGKQSVPVAYVGKLLEGFKLSLKPLQPKKKFPSPTLPSHFKPQHWFRKRRVGSHLTLTGEEEAAKQSGKLTAVNRGLLLGETPVMGSVFDLIPKDDKSRIKETQQALAWTQSLATKMVSKLELGQISRPATLPEPEPTDLKSMTDRFVSKFGPAEITLVQPTEHTGGGSGAAKLAEKAPLFQGSFSFQPFRKDPAKQARYDKYLTALKQGVSDPYAVVASSHMTEWERSSERDEFSKAAKIFRPMSAMMASRFVRGAMIDDKEEIPIDSGSNQSDQAKAADMKMFGKLTREDYEWHPDQVLCRRFNVLNPYPGSDLVGIPKVKRDRMSVFNFLNYHSSETQEPSTETHIQDSDKSMLRTSHFKKPTRASVFKVLDTPDFDHQTNQTHNESEGEKRESFEEENENLPEQDLFRAIFKNSDSESSRDESSNDETQILSCHEEDNKLDDETDDKKTWLTRPGLILTSISQKTILDKECSSDGGSVSVQMQSQQQVQAQRSRSRWGEKSIFQGLDAEEAESKHCLKEDMLSRLAPPDLVYREENAEEYGPRLPPPSTSALNIHISEPVVTLPKSASTDRTKKYRKERQKHKKEKKKKSQHKKSKKKNRKSSKKRKSERESSGSEADTESDSDQELINNLATCLD